jgi:hypothetical protein
MQSAHDGEVDRLAVLPGCFGSVDRELLLEREAVVIDPVRPLWAVDELPIALADADSLQGYQRSLNAVRSGSVCGCRNTGPGLATEPVPTAGRDAAGCR